ncbi:hypothetical protein NBRC10512_007738 [Rhodotorula toruloides]|uniref:RHTO0S01e16248g1_1 n=2 Tax=Rhodotorula toruloides TaxID=5286 RepID=A0A061AF35_RHOTO|nr:engulfment and cell motility protein 1 [Rhodotorula toruloides NP11]EMS19618.1 engulfment and cell motility protein 1 [Rhodotorula toruloides NP11]CDR36191.1 RHTO0S01e16248g1_1 [Rhodotorula toruloides]
MASPSGAAPLAAAPSASDFPVPPSSSSSSPPAAPAPPSRPQLKAHYFHYSSRQVKARIDPEVPLEEIVKQLCASSQLGVKEPAGLFALREREGGELVTEENVREMLEKGTHFTLVSSPMLEAVEMVDKLRSTDPSTLKPAVFTLRTLIRERLFLREYVKRGGVEALQGVIKRASGNTLAYALVCLQGLLELDERGWEGIRRPFVARIVEIVTTEPLINVSRPATAILRRLASQPYTAPNSSAGETGFSAVFDSIFDQPDFLAILVGKLSSGDVEVTNLSLGLLESLLRGSNELRDLRVADALENLDAWKTVGKLLDQTKGADLSALLSLQHQLLLSLHVALTTPIDEPHYHLFDEVWVAGELEDTDETNRWRRLGFKTEAPQYEFEGAGLLGLKALKRFAEDSQNEFAQTLRDQLKRPEAQRLPLSTASTLVLRVLASYFEITSPPSSPPPTPSPYLFRLYELHALVVQFFARMWVESGATNEEDEVERVAALTRGQAKYVLGGAGGEKSWFKVRQELLNADYKTVRDRQLRELAIEDDLLSKAPVRNLRGRLYLESYEFVKAQRIACLHRGAWFLVSPSTTGAAGSGKKAQGRNGQQVWRFYRLAPNRKVLHWVDAAEKREIGPGLDELPEKIEVSSITEIVPTGGTTPQRPPASRQGQSNGRTTGSKSRLSFLSKDSSSRTTSPAPAPDTTTSLSFTLHTHTGPLVELTAPSASAFSEWVDGLSLLRPDGNIVTRATADYIQTLTDFGVKVKLLDLSGERIKIPAEVTVDSVPDPSARFYYADSF